MIVFVVVIIIIIIIIILIIIIIITIIRPSFPNVYSTSLLKQPYR